MACSVEREVNNTEDTNRSPPNDSQPEEVDQPNTGDDEAQSDRQTVWLSEAYMQSAFHLNYEIVRVLGCGGFGRVYEVKPRDEEDEVYAAKVADLRNQSEDAIRQEFDMLALVPDHDNCIKVIEVYFENPYSYIILERCGKSLAQSMASKQVISEITLAFYFKQAFQALEAIHNVRLVHRDVKLDNLMVEDETVKLIDFGQAVEEPKKEHEARLAGTCGTPPFMSAEMVRGDEYGIGTDVWSLGVCLYTCMLGHFPYRGLVGNSTVMKAAIRLGIPEPAFCFTGQVAARMGPLAMISEDADQLLRSLLQRRPAKRRTAVEALQHAWISRVAGMANPDVNVVVSDIDFRLSMHAAWEVGAFSKGSPLLDKNMDQDMIDLQAHAHDFMSYYSTRDSDNVM